jgi:type II secretory pathway component PulM
MTPAALRDDLFRQANAHVPSTKALRTLVEQLLQDHTVLDAIQHVLDTAQMSKAGEPSGAAGGIEASTVPHTEAGGRPLDTYAQVLTPVLAKLLAAGRVPELCG